MKVNIDIIHKEKVKNYPVCNDGDIFIAKNILAGYSANTIFICNCFSNNEDPEFNAVRLFKVNDGTIRAKCDVTKIVKDFVEPFHGIITIQTF